MTSSSSVTSGLTMLTSGVSQYLHPDYLQPLPTTLDAKKSPLALLAQTCSAIGKDTSPSKPIIPPLEKSTKDNNDKTSSDRSGDSDSSSSSHSKRPSSHGHKDSGRESSSSSASKPGFRTFPPKEIPPLVPVPSNGENNNGSSKSGRLSSAELKPATSPLMNSGASSLTVPSSLPRPVSANGAPRTTSRGSSGKGEGDHHHHHHNGAHHHHHHQHQQSSGNSSGHHSHHSSSSSHHHRHRDSPASSGSSSSSSSTTSSSSQHPRPSSSPSYSKSSSTQATSVMHSPPNSSSSSAMKQPPTHASHSSMLGGLPAHLGGYPNPLALMGHGLDASSYHSALAAHSSLSCYSAAAAAAAAQCSALKAAAAGGSAAALSSFVTYARVRTPSGATTLVPVCRDPYCTTCQLTVQNSHLSSTCSAPGCAQCAHEKSLTSLSALGSVPGAAAASSMLLPPLSSAGSALSGGSMSALSSLHSLYPHSALAAAAAAHQGLPPYVCSWVAGSDYCGKRFNTSEELLQHLRTHTSSLDVSSLAASYAGLGGIPSALAAYPHLSAPVSPNSLRRAYPTSLSPVSSLLSASRYHPYKSPLSGVGAPPPQALPPVGPYYSPYTLYGQRIGAAVVP
ncbi:zinc finger protein [Elysia marginata]|uniref:Zinc finger protein n=1 Tax=Elysia marginata TaxID=1093978 RepID=A0AAV4HVA9_9GAST|nr:zinc finger protein [Elysia marginata]